MLRSRPAFLARCQQLTQRDRSPRNLTLELTRYTVIQSITKQWNIELLRILALHQQEVENQLKIFEPFLLLLSLPEFLPPVPSDAALKKTNEDVPFSNA